MSFSNSSEKYFSLINRVHYSLFKIFKTNNYYLNLIKKGKLPRPHYALGMFLSAFLAKELKIKKISVLEFGCWKGEALFDMEIFANDIEKLLNVNIEIYGFEGGDGLPQSKDFKDRLYQFSPGEMKTGFDNYFNKLNKTKTFFGEFKNTVNQFTNTNHAPIGCIFNDADYFSSTLESFEVLKDSKKMMPKVYLYFDDLNFSSSFTGELGAINEFNKKNNTQIECIPEFAEYLSLYWRKWLFLAKRFYLVHNFNHKEYNSRYINALLSKNI